MKKVPFLFFLIFLVACGGKKKRTEDIDVLQGKWNIDEASRNGRKTTTLKDGYMTFLADQTLETNILGQVTNSNYSVETDKLETDGDFNFSFNIEKLTSDSLVLSGRMKVFNMIFYLTKDTLGPEEPLDIQDEHVN